MYTSHNPQRHLLIFHFQILDLNVKWDLLFLNSKNNFLHILKPTFVIVLTFLRFQTQDVITGSIKAEKYSIFFLDLIHSCFIDLRNLHLQHSLTNTYRDIFHSVNPLTFAKGWRECCTFQICEEVRGASKNLPIKDKIGFQKFQKNLKILKNIVGSGDLTSPFYEDPPILSTSFFKFCPTSSLPCRRQPPYSEYHKLIQKLLSK